MNMHPMSPTYAHKPDFISKVMGYVTLAFLIAATGTYTAMVGIIPITFFTSVSPWIIYIAVMALALTSHMWSQAARPMNFLMFTVFSFLMGLMFFPLLMVALEGIGLDGVTKAFGITGLMTLAAGMYGRTTQKDLSGFGGFFTFAIIGLIITSIVNAIWFSNTMEMIISGVGVLLFSGLIAYEMNVIKHYPEERAMEAGIGLFISIFNLLTSVLRLLLAFNRN